MKALILQEYSQFAYTDVPDPEVGDGDLLVDVQACGICGSDVHGMDGSTGRRIPPLIMGHEASGVVTSVGSAVTSFAPGDRVTFDSTIYCGECSFCRGGHINLCDNRKVLGVSCDDYRRDGAFAELVTVPARIAYRLPDSLSFQHAAMVEPVSVGVHAVARTNPNMNDTALVVGAGVIGLLAVQAARAAGCGRIIVADVDPSRLELARTIGADHVLDASENAVASATADLTGGRGVDIAFEAVGVDATVQTAVAAARKGGKVALVGNVSPEVHLPLQTAVTRELTLFGSCASCGEYGACLDMMARGAIDVAPLVSAVAPLAEGASWFQRLHGREPGLMKVLLVP
ncbi:MAG: galactitol-1-phosphate 5-dehydrogenase [bacterium]|nr:galactitol-1-phosphate 5-dehydrogenase [bacterium]